MKAKVAMYQKADRSVVHDVIIEREGEEPCEPKLYLRCDCEVSAIKIRDFINERRAILDYYIM